MNPSLLHDKAPETLVVATVGSGSPEEVRVPVSSLFTFPEALPGLEESHRYALITRPECAPFLWLQSLDEAPVCLPVLRYAEVALSGYLARVAEAASDEEADLSERVLLVARYDEAASTFLVNLMAPIVLDPRAGLGRQVIMDRHGYALRQSVQWDADAGVFRLPC